MRKCKNCLNDTFVETLRYITTTQKGVQFKDGDEFPVFDKAKKVVIDTDSIDMDNAEYHCEHCGQEFCPAEDLEEDNE